MLVLTMWNFYILNKEGPCTRCNHATVMRRRMYLQHILGADWRMRVTIFAAHSPELCADNMGRMYQQRINNRNHVATMTWYDRKKGWPYFWQLNTHALLIGIQYDTRFNITMPIHPIPLLLLSLVLLPVLLPVLVPPLLVGQRKERRSEEGDNSVSKQCSVRAMNACPNADHQGKYFEIAKGIVRSQKTSLGDVVVWCRLSWVWWGRDGVWGYGQC
jgi:hypothetical protein